MLRSVFPLLLVAFVPVSACAAPPVPEEEKEFVVYQGGQRVSFASVLNVLAQAEVVLVGENHDHKNGHWMELELLTALSPKVPQFAFALEMFERDVQGVLDEYLRGFITESAFVQASRPWPNYTADYRPLIEFCRERRIPVTASNAPRRYVSLVSRKGKDALSALPKEAKKNLAPLPYEMKLPAGYEKSLDEIFGGEHDDAAPKKDPVKSAASPALPTPEHLKQAQALWDATMADSILRARKAGAKTVLHLNGAMHSDFGYGIADRLRRREKSLKLKLVTIRESQSFPALPENTSADIADFVIVTR